MRVECNLHIVNFFNTLRYKKAKRETMKRNKRRGGRVLPDVGELDKEGEDIEEALAKFNQVRCWY